jgi:hypothetical protein
MIDLEVRHLSLPTIDLHTSGGTARSEVLVNTIMQRADEGLRWAWGPRRPNSGGEPRRGRTSTFVFMCSEEVDGVVLAVERLEQSSACGSCRTALARSNDSEDALEMFLIRPRHGLAARPEVECASAHAQNVSKLFPAEATEAP